ELGDLAGVMGEVRVHLEEPLVAARVGQALLETGDDGGAAAPLLPPLDQLHSARVLGHGLPDRLRRPVGAAVVRHPHVDIGPLLQDAADQGSDVLTLVVGRDHDQDALAYGAPPPRAETAILAGSRGITRMRSTM